MKSKYVVAVVAAGLLSGTLFAAEGSKGCGFKSSDPFGNNVSSGVKSKLCWNDRMAVSGQISARFTSTDSDATDDYNDKMKLNHAALIVDTALDSKWRGHFTFSDVTLENAATSDRVRIDEAMLYYDNPSLPVNFKLGYGFTNFGEFNNPYDFIRKPTEVIATNQQTYAGVVFSQGGAFAELYVVGSGHIGWGATAGYDRKVGPVGVHTKLGYLPNRSLHTLNSSRSSWDDGGTFDLQASFALPHNLKVGGVWVESRGTQGTGISPGFRMWDVNAAYHFNAMGFPAEVHGWYSENKADHVSNNILNGVSSLFNRDNYYERFNLIGYNTANLQDIWDVGVKVQVLPNVDLAVDYIESDGTNSSGSNRQLFSDYSLVNVSLTGRF